MANTEKQAQARTDWAEDHTVMANERTFSAALGAAGIAIGLGAVFGVTDPT